MDKRIGFVAAWLVAAVLAVTVGVLAVTTVGASIRGRGLLGDEVGTDRLETTATSSAAPTPDPDTPAVRRTISGDWGSFTVECRGTYAVGLEVAPDRAAGWRTISYDKGPDDDVDAVLSDRSSSVEVEVFCNRGTPTVAEIEQSTLADDD